MEKDKSRGLKHIKDKRKYKGNSKKDPKHVPVKLKPNLDTNWYRYEKDNVKEFQLTSSTDFSILASAPITQGHRFQFKSDKIIAEDAENKIQNELFSLDLTLLTDSILTIPFYQRAGIEEKYFVENQINFMKRNAEDNLLKYNQKYVTQKVTEDNIECTYNKSSTYENEDIEQVVVMEEDRKTENIIPPGDDISKVVSRLEEMGKSETTEKKSDEDLEQWLDGILDD